MRCTNENVMVTWIAPKANQIHAFCVSKYSSEAQMPLPGRMPKQAISYTRHNSSSNNDILMLSKRHIEFIDINPTFEQ